MPANAILGDLKPNLQDIPSLKIQLPESNDRKQRATNTAILALYTLLEPNAEMALDLLVLS